MTVNPQRGDNQMKLSRNDNLVEVQAEKLNYYRK